MGTDLTPLITAPPDKLPETVTKIFRLFLATNFPVRVKALARVIASEKPDLIGLQEAELWELIIPTFGIVSYDFVDLLLKELRENGLRYEVAAQNRNLSAELPDSQGNIVRLLDRDVILKREEFKMKVTRRQEANFKTNLIVPVGGQPVEILRGWSSLEVRINGHVFRMINTHLDPTVPEIRVAQAKEILHGPANTHLPLIITGDLNSPPDSTTYKMFTDAGFHDVWRIVGNEPGFTCCQAPDLLNPVSMLSERIDYILFKNGWKPFEAKLVGKSQIDRTNTGLWPSDHAGLSATLALKNKHKDR
jgi:endonuclease/exonuclease/phosphatase family metal-dependent hydrolase